MKRSYFLTIFILLLINFQSRAQKETFSNGAYRNSMDFLNHKPLYKADFTFTPKYNRYTPALCYIRARNPYISNRKLFRNVWGIYMDGTFYLNGNRMGISKGFIRIDTLEKYSCIKGPAMITSEQQARRYISGTLFGVAGYAVATSKINNENSDKTHYILNYKTGIVRCLSKNYLIMILQSYPGLLAEFYLEKNPESFEVLYRYIQLINRTAAEGEYIN